MITARYLRRILPIVVLACASGVTAGIAAADEVNIYTTREPGLIQPLLKVFTEETGIAVNTLFLKDGMPERVAAEGANSPADILMVVDIGNLADLVDKGVTQPIELGDSRNGNSGQSARRGRELVCPVVARPRSLHR